MEIYVGRCASSGEWSCEIRVRYFTFITFESCVKFERIAMKKLGEDVVVAFLGVMSAIDPHLKYMQHHSLELSSYTMISCIKLKQSGGWDF